MERLRSFVKAAFSYPRLLLTTHPVTAISIIATSVLFAVYSYIETAFDYSDRVGWKNGLDWLCHISLAILFFAVFALCIESIRAARRKIGGYIAFAVCAVLSFFMSFITSDITDRSRSSFWKWLAGVRDSLGWVTVALYIGALLVVALLLAVYFSYSNDIHQKFNDHVMNAHSNIFFTSIIYGVIQMGVLFLILIIYALLTHDAFDLMPPVIILINGLFFAPAVICALIRQNERANMFMQILVRYIMLTIALLAYAIIYIYILKLVITLSVPSNEVYAILTALFIISMFITYMSTTFENKGFLQKFAYNAPLIFAPFIIMQCYTVIVRIGQYGLTPKRYFGIAFIIFEIVYVVYYTVNYMREHEVVGRNLLLIVCVIVVVTVFIPGINARSLSTSLAKRTLSSYLKSSEAGEEIPDKKLVRANAAAGFLRDSDFGQDRLDKYFPSFDEDARSILREKATTAAKIMAGKSTRDEDEDDLYFPKTSWFNSDLINVAGTDSIDISGFSSMKYVHIKDANDSVDIGNPVSDTANLKVFNASDDNDVTVITTVDLTDYCTRFINLSVDRDDNAIDYDEFDRRMEGISVIDINENSRLYITQAEVARDGSDKPVYVDFYGYLLEK